MARGRVESRPVMFSMRVALDPAEGTTPTLPTLAKRGGWRYFYGPWAFGRVINE